MSTALRAPSSQAVTLLRFTSRAMPWTPLLASAGALAVVGAAVTASGAHPSDLYTLGAATVAAGALAGLQDPAAALLTAVPTPSSRRRGQRMALLVPATAALWVALLAAAYGPSGTDAAWPVGPLAALLLSGLAVATWTPAAWAASVAAATPPAWFLVDQLIGHSPGLVGTAAASWTLSAWSLHPWTVTSAATVAVLAGWRR